MRYALSCFYPSFPSFNLCFRARLFPFQILSQNYNPRFGTRLFSLIHFRDFNPALSTRLIYSNILNVFLSKNPIFRTKYASFIFALFSILKNDKEGQLQTPYFVRVLYLVLGPGYEIFCPNQSNSVQSSPIARVWGFINHIMYILLLLYMCLYFIRIFHFIFIIYMCLLFINIRV